MTSHQSPVRLSVAMIVRNAAEALRETLDSIHKIADEIVVVDTGSTDSTRGIAAQFAAHIVDHPWNDDFSAARNRALDEVSGDWILWLDAGEQVTADDAAALRQFVDQRADAGHAYAVLVQVPPSSHGQAAEQVGRVRLVPRSLGLRFRGRVRETLGVQGQCRQPRIEGLPYRLKRGSREHLHDVKQQRAHRNIRLANLEIEQLGPQPQMLNCLGDAFQTLEDNTRAAECFRHALSLAEPGSPDMLEAYYGLLTSLDNEEDRESQLSLCVQALEIYPVDAQLLCAMGGYLQAHGRLDLAMQSYQTAYQYGQLNPAVWHLTEVREIAAICQGLTLQMQDQSGEAKQVLEEALASHATSQRLRRHLIELHVKQGQLDEALQHVDQLPGDIPHREALRTAVRGASFAAQKNWLAAKAFLKTAYGGGCRDPICLRWLAVTLLSTAEIDEARPILQQWHQAEPNNPEAARYLRALQPEESPQRLRQLRVDTGGEAQQSTPAHPATKTRSSRTS